MSEVVPTLITLTHLVGMSLGSENKALLTIYIECEGPMTPLPPKRSGHLLQNWRTNIIIPRPLICIGSYKENRYTSIHSSIHAPLMQENWIILHCIVVGGPIDDPVHTAGEYTCVHLSMYEHLKKW